MVDPFDEDLMTQNIRSENDVVPDITGGKILISDEDKNIFVMNNHRWAFFCWQKFYSKGSDEKIVLVHIDRHSDSDAIDENYTEDVKTNIDLKYITNKYLKWDNFIDAFIVRNNNNVKIISLVHRYNANDGFGQDEEEFEAETFSDKEKCFQYLKKEKVDILDIDLDYFLLENRDEAARKLWEKNEIIEFFNDLFRNISYPKIITVATSPGCIGGKNDSKIDILKKVDVIYQIVEKSLHQQFTQKSKMFSN